MKALLVLALLLGGCFRYHFDMGPGAGPNRLFSCMAACGVSGYHRATLYNGRYCRCDQ